VPDPSLDKGGEGRYYNDLLSQCWYTETTHSQKGDGFYDLEGIGLAV